MTRIFSVLAWASLLCVVANLIVGLMMGDLHDNPTQETLTWATVHRLGGVAAALAVVFANSIVITYFVGTSRWVREVSETYQLDKKYILESNRIKRRAFPWAVTAMLVIVGLLALGGAADPSTGQPNTANWVMPHFIGSFLVLGFLVWASFIEWNHIAANHAVIEQVLEAVKQIRSERGLKN